MSQPVERCPLCASPESRLFDRRSFQGIEVRNQICTRCGLVYQSPRMSDDELALFYEAEYRRLYQGSPGPSAKDLAVQRLRADALYAFCQRRVERVTRHLDIGCSAGSLLQRLQAGLGSQPVGVEPGQAYRQHAQAQGLRVYAALNDLKTAGEPHFDLVSLAHVLEHIPDPLGYLAELRQELLAPDGWLLLEVPNLYAHDSFEVAHLVSYSPHTLRQVLEQAGYSITILEAHGRPRSKRLPLYLTALARPAARPAASSVIPETGVASKRRRAMLRRRILERLSPRQAWLPIDPQAGAAS